MNYDEYDEKKTVIDKEIEDLQEEYQSARMDLERRFNEQLEIGNKEKLKIEENRTELNQKISMILSAANEFYSSPDARASKNVTGSYEKVSDKAKEYSDKLQEAEDHNLRSLEKLNQDYQNYEDELLSEYTKEFDQKLEQLDKLKDELDD